MIDENGITNFMELDYKNNPFPVKNFYNFLKSKLHFNKHDSLKIILTEKDSLGFINSLYQQYYDGIEVEYGMYAIHSMKGNISSINGNFLKIEPIDMRISVSEKEALQSILRTLNAKEYSWENASDERLIKTLLNDSNATNYPKGKLLIAFDDKNREYKIAYKFYIYTHEPFEKSWYYVDATTGNIFKNKITIKNANSLGWADTKYSGRRQITTESSIPYILTETRATTPGNIVTFRTINGVTRNDYRDLNNDWNEYHSNNEISVALEAHWALEVVLDYWSSPPRYRSSWDNKSSGITNLIYTDPYHDNAYFESSTNSITYGLPNHLLPMPSLDIVAHEFGHGILDSRFLPNGIDYSKESGAIDESLGDIWGACVSSYANEHFSGLNKQIWQVEFDVDPNHIGLRSMNNPNLKGQPDTYGGQYYYKTDVCSPAQNNDYCGVHTNSGIMNYWFYLLTSGGSGINDLGNAFSVYGISLPRASYLVYLAETSQNLITKETFEHFKAATILSAEYFYLPNSMEVKQVKNAWYAVGIGSSEPQIIITRTGGTGGNNYACSNDILTFTLNNLPTDIISITWTYDGCLNYISGQNSSILRVSVGSSCGPAKNVSATLTCSHGTIAVINSSTQWIGPPSILSISGPSTVKTNVTNSFYANVNKSEGTSYNWWTSPSGPSIWPYSGTNMANICIYNPGYYTVYAQAYNSCGQTTPMGKQVSASITGYMIISPNPASDEIAILISQSELQKTDSINVSNYKENITVQKYTVKIVDKQGILVYRSINFGNPFNISLSNLSNGNYVIIVNDGLNEYSQQFVVNHNK